MLDSWIIRSVSFACTLDIPDLNKLESFSAIPIPERDFTNSVRSASTPPMLFAVAVWTALPDTSNMLWTKSVNFRNTALICKYLYS